MKTHQPTLPSASETTWQSERLKNILQKSWQCDTLCGASQKAHLCNTFRNGQACCPETHKPTWKVPEVALSFLQENTPGNKLHLTRQRKGKNSGLMRTCRHENKVERLSIVCLDTFKGTLECKWQWKTCEHTRTSKLSPNQLCHNNFAWLAPLMSEQPRRFQHCATLRLRSSWPQHGHLPTGMHWQHSTSDPPLEPMGIVAIRAWPVSAWPAGRWARRCGCHCYCWEEGQ